MAASLAWIAPLDGVLNVWVAPIGDSEAGVDWAAARAVTADTERGVRVFAWAHDGRHLLYLQDAGGDENWRLYDVELELARTARPDALRQDPRDDHRGVEAAADRGAGRNQRR